MELVVQSFIMNGSLKKNSQYRNELKKFLVGSVKTLFHNRNLQQTDNCTYTRNCKEENSVVEPQEPQLFALAEPEP